jgi:hypothetical protein
MTEHSKDVVHILGGVPCRAEEFSHYNRAMLQHEREFLSKTMANQRAFLKNDEEDAIMHDLTDIDYFLANRGSEGLVKTPFGPNPGDNLTIDETAPAVEMWPASEGDVRPSQRKS